MKNFNNTQNTDDYNENLNNEAQSNWGNSNVNNYPQNNYTRSGWSSNSNTYDYTQDDYLHSDFSQTNWGSNRTDNWDSNSSAYNNTVNNYPQDNYSQNNYQQNNYYSDKAKSNYYNSSNNGFNYNNSYLNANFDNSNKKVLFQKGGFTIEMQKTHPKKFYLEKYRTPDDPQSAEIVCLEKKKESPLIAWIYFFNLSLIMTFGFFGFVNFDYITPTTAKLFKDLCLLSIGTIFLINGIISLIDSIVTPRRKKARCTQSVIATIADAKTIKSSNGNRQYYPIYKFYYEGKIYILNSGCSACSIEIGDNKEIYINPNNPHDYFISSHYSLSAGIINLIFAIIPMIIALVIVFNT